MIYTDIFHSPIGDILLAEENGYLTGAWFSSQKYFPQISGTVKKTPTLELTSTWLQEYFEGGQPNISMLPVAPNGSIFRISVWNILKSIPYGQTVTYGRIAAELERTELRKVSAQAVGGAVAHNPISVIIPCHRVVGTDGSLTGYSGGLERKQWLLDHEKLISFPEP